MSIASKFVLHGIVNGATFLTQIENSRVSPEANIILGTPAGQPFPLNAFNTRVVPSFSFDTGQLATLMAMGGSNGVHYIDLSGSNTDLYFKKAANLSSRVADATAQHQRYRAAMAGLSVDRITAGDQSPARASCRLVCLYNGSASPLVALGSQSLSGTPTFTQSYLAGPVSFTSAASGAVTVTGVQEVTWEFQRQIVTGGGEGEQYATHSYQQEIRPVLTIRGYDMLLPTIGPEGLALTAFASYLRRSAETGPYANATSNHIKCSGTTALLTVDEATGGANDDGMTTLRITTVGANATTDPIAIAINTTIS